LEEWQMEKETAEALTKSREILAAAAQEGAHILFAPQSLEILGRLSPASDDYTTTTRGVKSAILRVNLPSSSRRGRRA
jgi:hypothetical protein